MTCIHELSTSEAPTTVAAPLQTVGQELDLRPGLTVGGCEVLRLIGRGGLSSVYQVRHLRWGVDMALKVPQAAALDRLTAEVFTTREALAWLLPALHPHVAACHYAVKVMGRAAIFMEYVEGRNLAALMDEEGGPLYVGGGSEALARLLDIMIQAARGVEYLHSLGLRNLDIKPANLLLTAGGRLVLADFAPLNISAARVMGTRQYYSPEAAENRGSGTADLWALALSGLECCLGRRPWEAGSIVAYALDFYLGEPWAVPPPPVLADFFRKALAHDMAERYQSAAEMEGALLAVYAQTTGWEYPRAALGPLPESAERLNNKAFSFLELGKPDLAEELTGDRPVRRLSRVSPVVWF